MPTKTLGPVAVRPPVDASAPGPRILLRPRTDDDNEFIQDVTERELVPTLERAWRFKWDRGHARKFMLDLLTIGHTLVAEVAEVAGAGKTHGAGGEATEAGFAPAGAGGRADATGGRRVGYVWYVIHRRQWRPLPERVFWLNYLVLDAKFQGQGLGADIVHHCTTIARDGGCTSIDLWVQPDNSGAQRFYERHRFRPLRTVDGNMHMRRNMRRNMS